MRRLLRVASVLAGAVLVGAVLLGAGAADAQEKEKSTKDASYWMKRKLELSQQVLEGLTLADFEKIGDAARTMDKLNSIEKFIRSNPDYRAQLEMFRFANNSLIKSADKKNLAGATLAFNQLTLSCVNCHQQLRDTK